MFFEVNSIEIGFVTLTAYETALSFLMNLNWLECLLLTHRYILQCCRPILSFVPKISVMPPKTA